MPGIANNPGLAEQLQNNMTNIVTKFFEFN